VTKLVTVVLLVMYEIVTVGSILIIDVPPVFVNDAAVVKNDAAVVKIDAEVVKSTVGVHGCGGSVAVGPAGWIRWKDVEFPNRVKYCVTVSVVLGANA
jgi:hypothetical protein